MRVDRDERDKVAIDWDGVREQYERHKSGRRAALAAGDASVESVVLSQVQQALAAHATASAQPGAATGRT